MAEEAEEEEDVPVHLVTHLNNILISIVSKVEVYMNNKQIDYSRGLYAHMFFISNNCKGVICEYREFCTSKCMTLKFFLQRFMRHFCLNLSLLFRLDGFMLYGKMENIFLHFWTAWSKFESQFMANQSHTYF